MQIIKPPALMQKTADRLRRRNKQIGLVATMGAFHEGHVSLIRRSAGQNDITAVSIFVNPTQFGPGEDFDKYPRVFKADCRTASKAGADIVFHPAVKQMYPEGFQTYIDPGPIAEKLEGAARPGHMRGVATVCVKLFDIVKPHRAYFGQKDAQQLAVIRSVVKDLNFDMKIIACPIIRTKTGVAMSSRHSYLSEKDLKKAGVIYQSLKLAKKLIAKGETDTAIIRLRMAELIESVNGAEIEYIAFNRWDDLEDMPVIRGRTLISMVVVMGGVRLLDNIIVGGKK
jgi:pantoate--beta-alanine ligase